MSRLEFCSHLARAIRNGRKTTTWKPLLPPDQTRLNAGQSVRCPFPPGSRLPMSEPWGTLDGKIIYHSSFVPDGYKVPYTPPPRFVDGKSYMVSLDLFITGCALRRLETITEEEARAAGMIPPAGSTHRAEYERQWRDSYVGAQGWDANPYCWLVSFNVVT